MCKTESNDSANRISFLQEFEPLSDAFTIREVIASIGYSDNSVDRWFHRGWLNTQNGKIIPKQWLIDFYCIYAYPSANEHKAADYADTANLISYVRRYCPTAKLALHEIWNWAWCDTDDTVVNDFANLEELVYKTAQANDIDIIIPTGRAFRFAIEDNDTIGAYDLITSDGIHAGTYGQYIAGACYVSTLFGIDITKNTFGDTGGDYASSYFDNYDLTPLRAAVAKAMGTSLGDVNRDGRIDADDIILVRKNLLGINISEYREIFMDANDDGEVDICDLVRLKKIASGMDIELKW